MAPRVETLTARLPRIARYICEPYDIGVIAAPGALSRRWRATRVFAKDGRGRQGQAVDPVRKQLLRAAVGSLGDQRQRTSAPGFRLRTSLNFSLIILWQKAGCFMA